MNSETEQIFIVNTNENQSNSDTQKIIAIPVTTLINIEDVPNNANMCRLCATVTEFVLPIFEGEGLQNNLADKIQQHLPIQVSQTDELPLVVCYQCASTVLAWHELVQCCVQADAALRTRLRLNTAQENQMDIKNDASHSEDKDDKSEGPDPISSEDPPPYVSPSLSATPELPAFVEPSPRANTPVPTDEPSMSCEYCQNNFKESEYKEHLVLEHSDFLFHCDECKSYLDRKELIYHMTQHAAQYANRKQANSKVGNGEELVQVVEILDDININENLVDDRHRKSEIDKAQNSESDTLSQIDDNAFSIADSTPSVTPTIEDIAATAFNDLNETANMALDEEQTSILQTYQALMQAAETDSINNDKGDSENEINISIRDSNVNEFSTDAEKLPEDLQSLNGSDMEYITLSQANEFSDHSDIENEFGQVPESVFKAIEDTQDGQSNGNIEPSKPKQQDADQIKTSDSSSLQNTDEVYIKPDKKSKNKTRSCPICNKTYTAASSYYYHLKHQHSQSKDHECDVCSKKFASKVALSTHIIGHSGEKPYCCDTCGKKFGSRASLYIHEQTHIGIKTFSCTQCSLSFRWRGQLLRHLKRHASEKTHICNTCGRAFSVNFDLVRHMRTHEPGSYTCEKCGNKFAQRRYLKVHMENIHFPKVAQSTKILSDDTPSVASRF